MPEDKFLLPFTGWRNRCLKQQHHSPPPYTPGDDARSRRHSRSSRFWDGRIGGPEVDRAGLVHPRAVNPYLCDAIILIVGLVMLLLLISGGRYFSINTIKILSCRKCNADICHQSGVLQIAAYRIAQRSYLCYIVLHGYKLYRSSDRFDFLEVNAMRNGVSAFTLIELLIVVAIIGILAIAVPNFECTDSGKVSRRK